MAKTTTQKVDSSQKIKEQEKIVIIDDPVEQVRMMVDMYIGSIGNPGYVNMVREILQNSLDEIIKKHTLDKHIIMSFDARNLSVIIEDNGQGIPIEMLEPVFTKLHSSSNYNKQEGSSNYSSGKYFARLSW